MKYIVLLLLLISSRLFSQTYSSNCTPAGDMEAVYKNDVFRLTLAHLKDIQSPYKDSVKVPALYRDSVARALYAIENMDWSPLKDTILNLFGFRDFNPSQQFEADSLHIIAARSGSVWEYAYLPKLAVYVSSNADFYNNWINGNYRNTVNPQINYLVRHYNLQVL